MNYESDAKNLILLNAINKTEVLLPLELQKLLEVFEGGLKEILESADRSLFQKAEISEEKIDRFFAMRATIDPEKEWNIIKKENIAIAVNPNLVHFYNGRYKSGQGLIAENTAFENTFTYPKELLNLPDPPPILYMKGQIPESAPIVAIVGTRKFSLYGKQVATELAGQLSNAGVTIISGLARGIDSFAHTACVELNNPTIAVLGSGIDEASIYPPENRNLAHRIIETGGTVISEFSPGAEPYQSHFPQRNRIVAGLSIGVIVVEAPFESGALITAKFALEQGKEVFSVPGPINAKNSEGTNMLIKNGAHPITCTEDVLEVLNLETEKPKNRGTEELNLSEEEIKILEVIGREAAHTDTIVKETGLPISTVNSALTMLEMKDLIKHTGNNIYAKIKN